MTKKARYFFIGGAEPDDVEDAQIENVVDSIDDADEETIDRIISYIRDNVDKKADEGIRQFGKREYIKKVLSILETNIAPVFPGMTGGVKGFLDLTRAGESESEEEEEKPIPKTTPLLKVSKEDMEKLSKAIDNVVTEILELPKLKKYKAKKDVIASLLQETILKRENFNEVDLTASLTPIMGTDASALFETLQPLLKFSKEYSKQYISEPGNLYETVTKILDLKREAMEEVLRYVDVEGLSKPQEETSFGNILLMYTYPNILAMTEAGYRERQAFVRDRPDKFGIPEWTMELELALRGENELSKVLVEKLGIKDYKFDNIFQLVNKQKAFEDVDIKIPGVAYIEVKGWASGTFEFIKFVHMAKLYSEHGNGPVYALARGIPFDTKKTKYSRTPAQIVTSAEQNPQVFDKFQIEVLPTKLLKYLKNEVLPTVLEYQKGGQEIPKELINGVMTSVQKAFPKYKLYDNKGFFDLQMPDDPSFIWSKNSTKDKWEEIKQAKKLKAPPKTKKKSSKEFNV